jgi:hypothetical protein
MRITRSIASISLSPNAAIAVPDKQMVARHRPCLRSALIALLLVLILVLLLRRV